MNFRKAHLTLPLEGRSLAPLVCHLLFASDLQSGCGVPGVEDICVY
jgi:hypothetical protein